MHTHDDDSVKALKIIVAILVTLFASWVGLMVGDSLLAGRRGLSVIFAICSMGALSSPFAARTSKPTKEDLEGVI